MTEQGLTHIDPENNQPRMVDVGHKTATRREATARSEIIVPAQVLAALDGGEIQSPKGPVFHTAIIAGTLAVKRTSDWIPFCHPLPIDGCDIEIRVNEQQRIEITCSVRVTHKTGVEMEALVGASAAALTVYDMCKALSHDMRIVETRLIRKTGGKSDV